MSFQTALHGAVAHNTQTSIRVLSQLAKWKGLHKVYYTADGATAIRGGKRKTVPMGLVCECVFKVQLKLHGPTKSISCTYFSTDMAKHNQTHPHPHTRTRAHVHAHAQQWQKYKTRLRLERRSVPGCILNLQEAPRELQPISSWESDLKYNQEV